jgi:hypothetical protein
MTPDPIYAWRDGWRRVFHAPAIVVGVLLMTILLALPLALTLRGVLQAHLGRSAMAETAADGVDFDWWQEFTSQASGLGATFTPSVIGFAAVLDNIGSVLDGLPEILPITAALVTYLAGWAFVSGAVIDRYARQRKTRAHGFFAAGGVLFFRFLRLACVAGLVYWFLFAYVHDWLFGDWYPDLTRDMDTERRAFAVRATFYAIFGALLIVANIVFDYAKIRIVVEDRRSVLGGLAAALRMIARRPGATFGLYALNALTFVVWLVVWRVIAPGVTGSGIGMWMALALGQLYVLARLLLKLQFIASQTALFQASLAHAAFTAAPPVSWPESPAAAAIAPPPSPQVSA